MSSLIPATSSELWPTSDRRTSRALGRLEERLALRQAALEAEVTLQLDKLDGLTQVTGAAMQRIGRVAQGQTAIEQLAPQASARLNALGEWHGLACQDVCEDTKQQLRRR